jgi:cell division protein FtsB
MSLLAAIATTLSRSLGFRIPNARKSQRASNSTSDVNRRMGIGFTRTPRRRHIPAWLIPALALGSVAAGLGIAYVRVELIAQGYQRASNVKKHQQLEEEQRKLVARVRELRDPVRLAALAEKAGLSRPDPERVISLAPLGGGPRP